MAKAVPVQQGLNLTARVPVLAGKGSAETDQSLPIQKEAPACCPICSRGW
jgi:hypothetical protein